ncbi:hypothetical protein VSX61_13155 [Brenneria populi subsp. brevivirga]|uniref:hypothetical protein n=1 Tax=Brenneria populi TaxID=1505588 RepID=UPI002E16FB82|nr:hypothetical protein [Brenneria populi subsp. brevivirga]
MDKQNQNSQKIKNGSPAPRRLPANRIISNARRQSAARNEITIIHSLLQNALYQKKRCAYAAAYIPLMRNILN